MTPISDRNRSASGLTVTPEDQERIYQFYHAGEKVSGAEGGGAWLVAGVLSPICFLTPPFPFPFREAFPERFGSSTGAVR